MKFELLIYSKLHCEPLFCFDRLGCCQKSYFPNLRHTLVCFYIADHRNSTMAGREVARKTLQKVRPILSVDNDEARRRVLSLYKAWYRQVPYLGEYLLRAGGSALIIHHSQLSCCYITARRSAASGGKWVGSALSGCEYLDVFSLILYF